MERTKSVPKRGWYTCPVCGETTERLSTSRDVRGELLNELHNHIRMVDDGVHGEKFSVPEPALPDRLADCVDVEELRR
jgi:hypothetical protein